MRAIEVGGARREGIAAGRLRRSINVNILTASPNLPAAAQFVSQPLNLRQPRRATSPAQRNGMPAMIIVLKPGSTAAEIDHVIERIHQLGLKPHISTGEHRTII